MKRNDDDEVHAGTSAVLQTENFALMAAHKRQQDAHALRQGKQALWNIAFLVLFLLAVLLGSVIALHYYTDDMSDTQRSIADVSQMVVIVVLAILALYRARSFSHELARLAQLHAATLADMAKLNAHLKTRAKRGDQLFERQWGTLPPPTIGDGSDDAAHTQRLLLLDNGGVVSQTPFINQWQCKDPSMHVPIPEYNTAKYHELYQQFLDLKQAFETMIVLAVEHRDNCGGGGRGNKSKHLSATSAKHASGGLVGASRTITPKPLELSAQHQLAANLVQSSPEAREKQQQEEERQQKNEQRDYVKQQRARQAAQQREREREQLRRQQELEQRQQRSPSPPRHQSPSPSVPGQIESASPPRRNSVSASVTAALEELASMQPVIGIMLSSRPEPTGVLVKNLHEDQPAYLAGIRRLDVIEEVNGYSIRTREDFRTALRGVKVGDNIKFTVLRNNLLGDMYVYVGAKGYTVEQVQALREAARLS